MNSNSLTTGLGKRISQRRQALNMTQSRLAEIVGIEPESISNIERGLRTPSLNVFISISNALEISPDFLLCDSIKFKTNDYTFYDPELEGMIRQLDIDTKKEALSTLKTYLIGLTNR